MKWEEQKEILMKFLSEQQKGIHMKEISRKTKVSYSNVVLIMKELKIQKKITEEYSVVDGRAHKIIKWCGKNEKCKTIHQKT